MGKKNKSGNLWKNLWSSTKKKIGLVLSSITILFPQIFRKVFEVIGELIKDRFAGWGNSMIDIWLASLPKNIFTDALAWLSRDIFNLISSVGALVFIIIVVDSWLITRKQRSQHVINKQEVGKNKLTETPSLQIPASTYLYKDIVFQQHWYSQNLIEIVHGGQEKGIGIRVNNGRKIIRSMQANMKRLYYKKNLSDEFQEISVETQPFWWDLGNKHSVNLEELEPDGHEILMFVSPVSAFPHFVFMTSAVPPESNFSGIPRHDGFYKVYIQFKGLLEINNVAKKMKPVIFSAEFKYEKLKFSEFKGKGYVKEGE